MVILFSVLSQALEAAKASNPPEVIKRSFPIEVCIQYVQL